MSIKGRIHSFESFGTLDGPGIRFVVFMQGCPLHCLYCHNRDTWDSSGGTEYTAEDVFSKVSKYLPYMKNSGGGVTLSGGEPTLQPEFAAELFRMCRAAGIHTVLDTNGHTEIDKAAELLDYTDLVLLDIKHATKEGHLKVTGFENTLSRKFADYLSQKGIPVWIRYVLVPGYTDSESDLEQVSEIIKGMSNVEKVEVLPYHCMGKFKWTQLGFKYPLEGVPEPDAQQIEKARQRLTPKSLL